MMQEQNNDFTPEDLQKLREEKVEFNKRVLGLNEEKAEEWADRTIQAITSSRQQ